MNSEKKQNIAAILTGVSMFLLPFVFSRNLFYAGVNAKYFFVSGFVCLLLAILAWHLFYKNPISWNIKKSWLLYSIVLVLAIYYLSAFNGVYFWRSFFSDIIRSDGVFFLTIVGLMIVCLRTLMDARGWNFVRKSIAVSGGLFALLTYFGPGGLDFTGRLFTVNFAISGLTFANDTFAGAYILLSILLTIIEVAKSWPDTKKRYLYGIALLLQIFSPLFVNLSALFNGAFFENPLSLVGGARASAVTLFLVLVYLLGLFMLQRIFKMDETKRRVHSIWIGLWAVGFVVVVVILLIPGSSVQKFYLNESSEARLVVWEKSLEAIKEKPVLGWGPRNFQFAFQEHFDNRLYLDRGGRETWFDKAHNFFIDTLIEVGFAGLISIIILAFFFIRTTRKAWKLGIISNLEKHVLFVMVFAHIFQLQTAFDTISTYVLLGVILSYGVWLENRILGMSVNPDTQDVNGNKKVYSIVLASVLLLVFFGLSFVTIKEYRRQTALLNIFKTTNSTTQTNLAKKAMAKVSDFESLRLSSSSLIKGGLAQIANPKHDPKTAGLVLAQLAEYESFFDRYLEEMPTDYRARMNYAYVLLTETTFGQKKISEAKKIISESYVLSPSNPLTYALDAVAELYSGNLVAAKAKTNEMLAINPEIRFSQEVASYVERQSKQFPSVTILKLENL